MMTELELTVGSVQDGLWLEFLDTAVFGIPGAVLHQIYVDPRLRGRGLGTQLLLYLQRHYDHILLAPVPDRDTPFDVEEWYARHGFRPTLNEYMMEWWS